MRRIGKCLVAAALAIVWGGIVVVWNTTALSPHTFSGGTLAVDTTLTAAESPYLITENIVVLAGISLTLEPGAILKFAPGTSMLVAGKLTAEGTAEQPITLTSNQPGVYWGAVGFWFSSADNRLSHVLIEYLTTTHAFTRPFSGLSALTSTLTIAFAEIRHARGSAVNFIDATGAIRDSQVHDVSGAGNLDGIHVVRGYVEIENNHIYDGHDYFDGIDVDGDGATTGVIRGNRVHDSNNDCLDLSYAVLQVEANTLYNCADKGISLGVAANPTVVNNLIYSSTIGLASKDKSYPLLINNTIVNNSVGLDLYAKATPWPGYATIHNSIIWDNDLGIRLRDNATVTVTHSNVQTTTVWPGTGNTNVDPQFWAPATGDFRLRQTSPCTDIADASVAPATDIRGVARPTGAGVDMGAFEFFERLWLYLPLITDRG